MSYRSRISVNPNVNVQGLQSDILSDQHALQQIQIDNDVFNSIWNNTTLTLYDNKTIPQSVNIASNPINTLYLEPTQEITFHGGVSSGSTKVSIDISVNGVNWLDANVPVILNSTQDFALNFHTQAPFVRLRFFNSTTGTSTIEKAYASYKFKNVKAKDGSVSVLDANTSFVTISN